MNDIVFFWRGGINFHWHHKSQSKSENNSHLSWPAIHSIRTVRQRNIRSPFLSYSLNHDIPTSTYLRNRSSCCEIYGLTNICSSSLATTSRPHMLPSQIFRELMFLRPQLIRTLNRPRETCRPCFSRATRLGNGLRWYVESEKLKGELTLRYGVAKDDIAKQPASHQERPRADRALKTTSFTNFTRSYYRINVDGSAWSSQATQRNLDWHNGNMQVGNMPLYIVTSLCLYAHIHLDRRPALISF